MGGSNGDGASPPARAASEDVRCDDSSQKSGDGTPIDDSDDSPTSGGVATPTSSHDDAAADGHGDTAKGGGGNPLAAGYIASMLAKGLAKDGVSESATQRSPRFSQGSRMQLLDYWRRCVVYAPSPLPAAHWIRVESTLQDYIRALHKIKEEFWFSRNCTDLSTIYSGASIRWRPALVSTARGAKHVNGVVISQFSTAPEYRRRGHGTRFLKSLATEMDKRKGDDRIDFSIVFGGPNTNFLKERG
ncbi:hypothetical protein J3F83DRAFT_614184 [Trichoderma novae-zelandiae]